MKNQIIKPVFKQKNIAVVFATDTNYVPYMAVSIQSIFSHANSEYNYDLLIFDDGISDYQKEQLSIYQTSNFSLRYIDIKPLLNNMDSSLFKARGIWSAATFYRLFIPQIMPDYDKVLYLDCDVLVKDSLVDLFNLDLGKNCAGCVYDEIRYTGNMNRISDINKYVGIKDYKKYFNAGMILFNIPKINPLTFAKDFMQALSRPYLPFLDQDVLNILWENKYQALDGCWNYQYYTMIEHPDLVHNQELSKAQKDRKIIHYITQYKPWNSPHLPHAAEWWAEARKTPFYEEIIYKNTKTSNILLRNLKHYNRLFGKYFTYKLLKNITFGQTRNKIETKIGGLKRQVKQVRAVYKDK